MGDITVPSKDGWDYLWVRYEKTEENGQVLPVPVRVHVLPAQRRIGNWLGIADVLCHPSDYESHCFSINEAWLAGVPVVSCDYLVNRLFEERHGPMMWLVPIRPEPTRLAAAIGGGVRRAE